MWTQDGAAVVVGGTGGIGAAITRLLVKRGSDVLITYRSNINAANALIAESGGKVRALQLDITDENAVAHLEAIGAIRTLVYAAGPLVRQRHLSKVAPSELRSTLIDDAVGFFTVVRATLPALRESGGSIVAVTSAAGRRYAVRDGLSVIPKASVEAIVTGIAVEEGRFGVRANCVGPGMLADGMARSLIAAGDLDEAALEAAKRNTPLRRFGTAHDIAEAVVFLASSQANFITGQKLDVDGGYGA
ncbi:SDR family NAD(P)-dependent oxidoreductase [Tomitella biformata]|uniref:SDR family NAD(P)-dependent oxidoreductase n=1 Tax=Tomitella biformata TaxID=630403 RepID=UPI0004667AFA|nr:SDR family oxidoreductase [Tomitella biformata]